MRPENRAVLVILVAAAVAVTPVAAYLLLGSSPPEGFLPIFAGTVFTRAEAATWVAHFTVGPLGGRLVGAWTAYNGSGFFGFMVVNGTVSKPPTGSLCPLVFSHWAERNGTEDMTLAPGPYTASWTTGVCSSAAEIDVTQTLQLLPP